MRVGKQPYQCCSCLTARTSLSRPERLQARIWHDYASVDVSGTGYLSQLTVTDKTTPKDSSVIGLAAIQNLTVVDVVTSQDLAVTGIATIEKLVGKDIEVTGSLSVRGGISTAIANKTANLP